MPSSETTTLSLERYAPDAKGLVAGAQAIADERKHPEVLPLHLLVRMLEREPGVVAVFRSANVDVVELQSACERALGQLPSSKEPAYLSASMLDLLERAGREAERERSGSVALEHLLNALSQEIRGPAGEILGAMGIAPGSLRGHLSALRSVPRSSPRKPATGAASAEQFTHDWVEDARAGRLDPVIGRDGEVRRLTTILERRQKNNTLLVGEPGVGKGAVISGLAQRIADGDVPTTLAGVRLLEIDAAALVAGTRLRSDVDERMRGLLASLADDKRGQPVLVARGMDQLFGQGPAGTAVGDFLKSPLARGEIRMLATTTPEGLRKIADKDPTVLRAFTTLPIDEPSVDGAIEILRGVTSRYEDRHQVEISEGAIGSAVRLAKRYLQDRFLPDSAIDLLDETAAAKRVETDGIPAPVDAAMRRAESLKAQLHSLERTEDAATRATRDKLAAELAQLEPKVTEMKSKLESRRGAVAAVRALKNELDSARAALEEARAKKEFAKLGELEHVTLPELEKRHRAAEDAARSAGVLEEGSRLVTEGDVAATLAIWTGIPVAKMLEGEADKLLKMETRLEQRVVGQDEAVKAIARAVRRGRVGLRDPGKPIGSFLFLGPSGVGKTELGKALAEFLFDDEAALTRLDMSEFMERHMAQRLIGAPPGYADSEQGGFLTEAVRRRPYSVLLFDEVEKAHQDVFNLLLQVLDDGRLTDGRGRSADFSNTVVIMTSNIGSQRILETDPKLFESEDGREALRDVLVGQLGEFFRPEFLNRIDDVVVFRSLTKVDLRKIVDIQLRRLDKLLSDRQVKLELSEEAKLRLVDLGYEPALGARPLRRAILKQVQDPLAESLLGNKYAEGTSIKVGLDGEKFTFTG
ncbi:MAG: AAA family ATPase [Polyangiaceae bacterium]|nr:AAA family ATPase [Polyangiaceae bacterium]